VKALDRTNPRWIFWCGGVIEHAIKDAKLDVGRSCSRTGFLLPILQPRPLQTSLQLLSKGTCSSSMHIQLLQGVLRTEARRRKSDMRG